jgi:arylsulfatase A-like enzyme/Flp pilus assembly protein TadD
MAAAVIIAAVAWWTLRTPAFAFDTNPDRNVLLVTIDTLRADAVGSYGGRAHTPNLDRLAAHGARFDFAHAHAVVTLVSHASILTGRYPYEHGIRANTGYRLSPTQATAATLLKARGFATGAFVGGFPLDHRFGLNVGFDRYDDRLGRAAGIDSDDRERRADAVVASALGWIKGQPGKWFAWVHVFDPHMPYDPPAEAAAEFPNDPYLAEVSWTDFALGPLFDRLAAESRPTLVVVTGDHGEGLGDHGELTHGIFAYESTLRVPLIVSEAVPGGGEAARGVVIETPVRHIDLLPTLLDAVGAPADPSLAGSSLKDVVAAGRGADRPSYFEAMMAAVARGWAPLRGVLVGREKYIDLPIAELYDLASDPEEQQNLAAARPDLTPVLYNTLKGFSLAPPGQPQQETRDTIERLRSLGYISGGSGTVREKYTEKDDPKRLIELEQMMDRGRQAFREGRPAEAVNLLRSVIERRPDLEDAYRTLASVYWRTGRPRDAVATLELALKNGVTQREVYVVLGLYLAESGQPARAIELLGTLAGDDPPALVALGTAYQAAGRAADAMRTFRHLVDVDPTNGLAYENIGTIQLQSGDYKAAETSLRHALELEPTLPGVYTALGVVLASTGRKSEAIDAWKRAVDLDRRDFNALFNLTMSLAEAGRDDEARAYGERFISTAPPALQQDVATIRRRLGGR